MELTSFELNTPEEIIEDIRQGKMVILMDDEDRENEGDLIMAAECVSAQDINFMAKFARGLICLTLTEERCKQLNLPLMVTANNAQHGTNFTVSIEAAEGVTTGISAADRAKTVLAAVAKNAKPTDIVQPGHIFPLRAQPGGVLSRAGHTEAGCDLARLAGREPASVIVEIMNEDGTMARRPELEVFAKLHNLKIGTIADLIHHQVAHEKTIEPIKSGRVNTDFGEFDLHTFRCNIDGALHFALAKGEIKPEEPTLVRVHLVKTMRDLFCTQPGEQKSWNLPSCLEKVAKVGKGVVVVIANQESHDEVLASVLIALGEQPVPVNNNPTANIYRTIGLGAQILRHVGVGKMIVLGAPYRYRAISGYQLEAVDHIEFRDDE